VVASSYCFILHGKFVEIDKNEAFMQIGLGGHVEDQHSIKSKKPCQFLYHQNVHMDLHYFWFEICSWLVFG
jgi:hypothetical protein